MSVHCTDLSAIDTKQVLNDLNDLALKLNQTMLETNDSIFYSTERYKPTLAQRRAQNKLDALITDCIRNSKKTGEPLGIGK